MSMVVQHNLQAMNANRLFGITTGQQAKSTEKLSSGYRINRAADDAAGLTISEKMRRQVRGLTQASTNAQDGVSSVQTAEGALTEVHSMLQRMNELATQAANGTESQNDRDAIQAEINQLSTEIDRVAETTKFNEIYLLKGDAGTKTVHMNAHDAGLKGTLTDQGNGKATFVMDVLKAGDNVNIGGKSYKIVDDAEQTAAEAGKDFTIEGTEASSTIDLSGWTGGDTVDVNGVTYGQAAYNAVSDVVDAIQADLGDKWVVSADAADVITIKEAEIGGATAIAIDNATVAGATVTATTADGTITGVKANATLYAKDSTEALTDDKLLEAYQKDGLYTTAGVSASQSESVGKNDFKIDGTQASSTIDLNGWTGGDTIDVNGVTYGQATYNAVSDVVSAIQNDLGDKWVVSADAADVITITEAETGGAAAITIENATVAGATVTATTADGVINSVTTDKPVYAKGGTEALTDEQIKEAYTKGETLFYDAASRPDDEITAKEAYKLAKDELLKANQIGDVNKSAKVTYGSADEKTEKTAADYKAGDTVTISGTAYTIGDTEDNVKTAINDAITAAATAAATPPNTTGATPTTKVGTVTDAAGTDTINIFKKGDGNLVYSTAASLTHTQAGGVGADKAATDVEALVAAGATVIFTPDTGDVTSLSVADDATIITAEKAAELENAAAAAGDDAAEPSNVFEITTGSADVANTLRFNLHVGADADMTNKISVNIETMNSAYLGIKGLDLSDTSGNGATYAIDAIQDAISKVSAQRSTLGAIQNRLEHTIANLDNVVENTTSAESRIRDTDMASEMVEYSKNNILAQAGQSMLAQANQSTQGVLSLLG